MKRRPFILMEVLIATALVTVFTYFSLQGFFKVVSKQRKMLQELDYAIKDDKERMDLVATYWGKVKTLVGKSIAYNEYLISTREPKKDRYYLLEIENKKTKRKYSYFVDKARE